MGELNGRGPLGRSSRPGPGAGGAMRRAASDGKASLMGGLRLQPQTHTLVAQCGPMDVIAAHAAARPDAPVIIEEPRRLTWREYLERRNRLAHALAQRGLRAGEHVIVSATNSIEYML